MLITKSGIDNDKKTPVMDTTNPQHITGGLDVDLAKALKVFFKDVRGVQQQLRYIKQTG